MSSLSLKSLSVHTKDKIPMSVGTKIISKNEDTQSKQKNIFGKDLISTSSTTKNNVWQSVNLHTKNTLKGAGVGVVAGTVGGVGAMAIKYSSYLPMVKNLNGPLAIGAISLGVQCATKSALIGGISGAVVSNVTKNPKIGTVVGAATGGIYGGLIRGGGVNGTIIGVASGGLAGYFASKVSK